MKKSLPSDISSLTLHLFAMAAMLCDHLWATIVPGNDWLTWVGRLAFPVFAFLLVEGYFHTRNFKKYLGRMALFALISELPFNLMYTGSWIFPFHQNVLWSFSLALLCMKSIDGLRQKLRPWLTLPLAVVLGGFFALAAQLLMADYYGYGILMVLVFYVFRGNAWYLRLGQLLGLYLINWEMMGSMTIPLNLFSLSLEIPQQGMAVLALIPIWLYRGRQGARNTFTKLLFYGFYPAHMLVLGLLSK